MPKMKAIVKEREGPGFVLKEVDYPEPARGEVTIKVEAVGICGSDIPVFDGRQKLPILPYIPGHEFSGTIYQKGKDVKGFEVRDRVAVGLVVHCRDCHFCRLGEETMCDNSRLIGCNYINGAFAEYIAVPIQALHRLPDSLSYEDGASIDPIASAYRPIKKACISSEDTVVIVGAGAIGLYALQLTRCEGAWQTIVLDTVEKRLKVAKDLGATHVIDINKEDPFDALKRITENRLADVVVEVTGTHKAVNSALSYARKQGRVILVSIYHEFANVDIHNIVGRELKIFGSLCYTWEEYEHCLHLLDKKKVVSDPIITHVLSLGDMEKALKLNTTREAIKCILKP